MMKVVLSERLMMSARMAGYNHVAADIGCDHAHMDIWLLQNGLADACIAMDVRPGPLEKAKRNLELYGCDRKVELRLGNGFAQLRPGEADCAFLTGMGGALMTQILEEGLGTNGHLKDAPPKKLILQPQSHVYDVRRWLGCNRWRIVDEDMVYEDGKYYVSVLTEPYDPQTEQSEAGYERLNDVQLEFGPVLCRKKPDTFMKYLEMYERKCNRKIEELKNAKTQEACGRSGHFEWLKREAAKLLSST